MSRVFDFREHQRISRRWTAFLVALFLVMTATIGAIVGAAVAAGYVFATSPAFSVDLVDPGVFLIATGCVATAVLGTSLVRLLMLGGDGARVAEALGAVEIRRDATNPYHRQYLNVVEEMAVASGLPVPRVFVLNHEQGINAFAAGSSPENAAIGMTHGAISKLTRREMTGVVAHEMAHVANHDSRLNVRLMAMVFGLVALATVGQVVLRNVALARGSRNRDGAKAVIAIVLVALVLVVMGFLGVVGGRILQAALSRRREYLADATAVRFTGDPTGLARALRKVAMTGKGGKVGSGHVEEARHMFFSAATGTFAGLLATHPPIMHRIVRLDPGFALDPTMSEPVPDREAMRDARRDLPRPWGDPV